MYGPGNPSQYPGNQGYPMPPQYGQSYPQHPGYQQVAPPGPYPSGPMYPMQPPGMYAPNQAAYAQEPDEFENEPPLLEELGIDVDHIWKRIQSVVFFRKIGEDLISDLDMGGPLFIALALGVLLMFAGKVHFGYIYGLGLLGCVGAWLLVNVMSNKQGIDLYTTMSICGYALLPVVFLAFIGVFVRLSGTFGFIVSALTVIWCTMTASRFLECAVNMYHQRWLVAYPIALIYVCFVLITAL